AAPAPATLRPSAGLARRSRTGAITPAAAPALQAAAGASSCRRPDGRPPTAQAAQAPQADTATGPAAPASAAPAALHQTAAATPASAPQPPRREIKKDGAGS